MPKETWTNKIIEAVNRLIGVGGVPEVALVHYSVYSKLQDEIAQRVNYGASGPRYGMDYGTFMHVGGHEIEIVPRHDLDCSILIGERAGLLPETKVNYAKS